MNYRIKSTGDQHHVQVKLFLGYTTVKIFKSEFVPNPEILYRSVKTERLIPYYDFGLFQAEELLQKLQENE